METKVSIDANASDSAPKTIVKRKKDFVNEIIKNGCDELSFIELVSLFGCWQVENNEVVAYKFGYKDIKTTEFFYYELIPNNVFSQAMEVGNFSLAYWLLKKGQLDLLGTDLYGRSILEICIDAHVAGKIGYVSFMDLFDNIVKLEKGALESRNSSGFTPIMYLSYSFFCESNHEIANMYKHLIEFFIRKGADINAFNSRRETILDFIIRTHPGCENTYAYNVLSRRGASRYNDLSFMECKPGWPPLSIITQLQQNKQRPTFIRPIPQQNLQQNRRNQPFRSISQSHNRRGLNSGPGFSR